MGSHTASDDPDAKGNGLVPVALDVRNSDRDDASTEEHRQYVFGFKLPRYFNKDEDRRLVRKLDIFLMYALSRFRRGSLLTFTGLTLLSRVSCRPWTTPISGRIFLMSPTFLSTDLFVPAMPTSLACKRM